ncbi:App1 family protein [uncultured Hymenobacter sp.]|uniref:App1 family protein n=1 Tax=uncultured Hymenobacter sp. TaxID=170016 RepID=UPI0035CC8638
MALPDTLRSLPDRFDTWLTRAAALLGWLRPLQILPYRSYGTASSFYIKGRLLADQGIATATATDSRWRNFRSMYRRFNSREVAGAELLVTLPDGQQYRTTTDEEGYFLLVLTPRALPEPVAHLWYPVPLRLDSVPAPLRQPTLAVTAAAHVLVPPATAEFGVISDIDDTILVTEATSLRRMLGNVLLRNAHSHRVLDGVADFYQALQKGRTGRPDNPFFYVSSSPWNLYDVLETFLEINNIPPGPLLLRDLGLGRPKTAPPPGITGSAAIHFGHKLHEIDDLLCAYPRLPFVLLGDSGQEDARIYREVVRRHPSRIRAIYIRDVQVAARAVLVGPVAAELRGEGVEMLLVPDYAAAARHAATLGLISS